MLIHRNKKFEVTEIQWEVDENSVKHKVKNDSVKKEQKWKKGNWPTVNLSFVVTNIDLLGKSLCLECLSHGNDPALRRKIAFKKFQPASEVM